MLITVVTAGDKPDGQARVAVHLVPVKEKELATAAEKFWKACQNPKAGRPISDDLYKWLIEPVEKDIAGKKHLVIVPFRPVLTVPFQALAADVESPYLIEQFAVSYAPSVSALLAMRKRGNSVRGPGRADRLQVLALGGAKFTRDLEDLPESGPEADAIAKTFGDRARILKADQATRPELLKHIASARFLHFATHGEVNPRRPLFSALAVTPTDEKDDGRLYAHDVMNLELTAELAVLSACDSGRGREYRGEGTVGLAWAFFVAGTPAVVVSQWKVSDVATADLMREFYTRLRAGTDPSKAEALRQASLTLLKGKKTNHPMFWAPFVLIGDWQK
jgi:CHAT domain-containing protein